jgi:hypothetical protein
MIRQRVASSNLRSVGYDPASRTLEIEFNSDAIYQYDGVPADVHGGLMHASSHGSYFHQNIKDRYPHRRIG